jgi:hypothetical protein
MAGPAVGPREENGRRIVTLVMAFIGENGAVMGGDRREITFLGDRASMEHLEGELYSGDIVTDEELHRRAGELGVEIRVRDDKVKVKVTEREGVLVGEVTSLEGGVLRRRRLFASGGSYAIVDTEGPSATRKGSGGAGNFVVLGNERTKAVARRCIAEGWKGGSLGDARGLIARTMERAAKETASVSRGFILLETAERANVGRLVDRELDGHS